MTVGACCCRFAYFLWAAFAASGIALLMATYFLSSGGIVEADTCLYGDPLTSVGLLEGTDLLKVIEEFPWDSASVCKALYPDANDGSSKLGACVACMDKALDDLEPSVPLFITGIVLLVLSWVPCFYCCLCASAPRDKYYS